jgi:hypothetical protein
VEGVGTSNNNETKVAVKTFKINKTKASEQYGIMNCWNLESITDMSKLFMSELQSSDSFNEPIDCWNVGRVTNMNAMFQDASNSTNH